MSSLTSLLAQFQSRYPMASLVSEFLAVHEGNYVVRAIAQIGNTPLATGLAAAPDLEAAEDRAKVRALEALAMGPDRAAPLQPGAAVWPTSQASPPPSVLPLPPGEPSPARTAPASLPVYSSVPGIDTDLPDTLGVSEPGIAVEEEVVEKMDPPAIVADLYAHITDGDEGDDTSGEAIDLSKIMTPASQLVGKPSHRKVPAESAPVEPIPSSPPAIDFSDVLAQTDVELRRLGWDARKGREYLKQTYGKRSRQELSETELYDFLDHLKTQPSAGQSPF